MDTEQRDVLVTRLRHLADFYESIREPQLEAFPNTTLSSWWFSENVTVQEYKDGEYETDKDKSLNRIATINRGIPGKKNKEHDGDDFKLSVTLPDGFTLEWYVDRTVTCERVVKSTKTIPASTYTTPARVVEEVEWVCQEVVLLNK